MANNTNAEAIAFSNQVIRPMSDLLYTAYQTAKSVVSQWNAKSMSTVLPNDNNLLQDGATVASGTPDGRTPITDAQATNIITRCMELIQWMENGLVASPFNGTVTNATLNTVALVQVNGKAIL